MKALTKKRIRNSVILLGLYAGLLSIAIFDKSNTFWVGAVKGTVVGFTALLLLIFLGTAYYALKAGKGWGGVRRNLKGNLLAIVSFDFDEETTESQRKKK
jgi:hypothetical protein